MASQGFEFAYMLDGKQCTPVIRDFVLNAAVARFIGDLMYQHTDGDLIHAAASQDEVTCVAMENITAANVTAGTTKIKCAVITRNQVWRCSMDAATTALYIGYTKTVDIADTNTLDADGSAAKGILVDASHLDDDGNVLAHVVFSDTTWGNV